MKDDLPYGSANEIDDKVWVLDVLRVFVKSQQDLESEDAVGEEL